MYCLLEASYIKWIDFSHAKRTEQLLVKSVGFQEETADDERYLVPIFSSRSMRRPMIFHIRKGECPNVSINLMYAQWKLTYLTEITLLRELDHLEPLIAATSCGYEENDFEVMNIQIMNIQNMNIQIMNTHHVC